MGDIIKIKPSDGELLWFTMDCLAGALESSMEIKHPIGETLFHMVHAIMFYVERYLNSNDEWGCGEVTLPIVRPSNIPESCL